MNNVKRRYWADVKANGDFYCVETYSGYRSTRANPKGIQHLLQVDSDDAMLGEALKDALSRSRFVLPAPRKDVWIHSDATFDMELYDYEQSKARYQQWIAELMQRAGAAPGPRGRADARTSN